MADSMLQRGPGWARATQSLSNRVKTEERIDTVLNWSAEEMVKEARRNLNEMVYSQAVPHDMFGGSRSRTRRTYNAIKTRKIGHLTAMAIVDPSDYPAHFYAVNLNRGIAGTSYRARPFWTIARSVVAERAKVQARLGLASIRNNFAGRM